MFSKMKGPAGGMTLGGTKLNRNEMLLIAGLGIVIVGAIIIAAVQLFKGDGVAPDSGPALFHFQCESCGHEFTVDPAKEAAMASEADASNQPRPLECGWPPHFPRTCPSCDGKARQQSYCPNCKAWYLSDVPPNPYGMSSADPEPGEICRKCGTDVRAWYSEHAKK